MSQSAGTTQWELGNKLACQQTGLSLVIAGLWLVAQVWGCFSRKSDPYASRSQTLLDNLQLNISTEIPQTPWYKMIPNVKTLPCHAAASCESLKF